MAGSSGAFNPGPLPGFPGYVDPTKQQQQQQPLQFAMPTYQQTSQTTRPTGTNLSAGPTGSYFTSPSQGMMGQYTPNPNITTNLYQTAPGSGTYGQPGYVAPKTTTPGVGTVSEGAYEGQQSDQLRAQLAQQAFASRLAMLQPWTGTGTQPRVEPGGMGADETAARAAAFARAKEQAGGTALGALKGLKDAMASRGLTGSTGQGFESGGIADIIGGAAGGVNEFSREQLIQDLNRYADIANTRYKGDIEQRGQDLDSQRAILGLLSGGMNLF